MERLGEVALGMFAVIVLMAAFITVLDYGFKKEEQRLEKVREHNCKHYGRAINKHYGREVCPSTPNG